MMCLSHSPVSLDPVQRRVISAPTAQLSPVQLAPALPRGPLPAGHPLSPGPWQAPPHRFPCVQPYPLLSPPPSGPMGSGSRSPPESTPRPAGTGARSPGRSRPACSSSRSELRSLRPCSSETRHVLPQRCLLAGRAFPGALAWPLRRRPLATASRAGAPLCWSGHPARWAVARVPRLRRGVSERVSECEGTPGGVSSVGTVLAAPQPARGL